MLKKQNKKSKILDMVEEELHAIHEIKDVSVSIRKFNKIKYLEPKHYTSSDVIRIRKKSSVSQAVFAYLLNASESTIRKWEIGVKEPGGANCRLLQIIENKGLEVLLS
ncbi:MAG: transcriptional regulator [Candidatus Omnitrophica bacterium]|nr:transcriptional regulator [Candidatus Omnitrophota bacterium]